LSGGKSIRQGGEALDHRRCGGRVGIFGGRCVVSDRGLQCRDVAGRGDVGVVVCQVHANLVVGLPFLKGVDQRRQPLDYRCGHRGVCLFGGGALAPDRRVVDLQLRRKRVLNQLNADFVAGLPARQGINQSREALDCRGRDGGVRLLRRGIFVPQHRGQGAEVLGGGQVRVVVGQVDADLVVGLALLQSVDQGREPL